MTKLTALDVRTLAQEVCLGVVAPAAVRADREAAFPSTSIEALGAAGLLGLLLPEELGGAGLGIEELTAGAEVIASGCPSSALVMVAHGAASSAVAAAGEDGLCRRLLPDLATGQLLSGFAIHEPSSGCMAMPVRTRAARVGRGFAISGTKPFVTAANHLGLAVVLADLEAAGPSLFAVDTRLEGVSRGKPESSLGLRGAAVAELTFDGCTVPADALLGQGGDGLQLLRRTIGAVARFGVAGAALGIARAVQCSAAEHVRTRVTGGMPLMERPAVRAALATLSQNVDSIEAVLARKVETAVRHPEQTPDLAAQAKLLATELAVDAARHALEITGGHGYFGVAGIERGLRDALGLTVHLGPPALLREEVGRSEAVRGGN